MYDLFDGVTSFIELSNTADRNPAALDSRPATAETGHADDIRMLSGLHLGDFLGSGGHSVSLIEPGIPEEAKSPHVPACIVYRIKAC